MKHKMRLRIVAFILVSLLAVGETWASTTYTIENKVTNAVTTGKVDIVIDENYEPNDGKDLVPSPPENPKKIKKEVRIQNTGGEAFVRVKFDKVWGSRDKDDQFIVDPNLSTDNIKLFFEEQTDWKQIGDYYYIKLEAATDKDHPVSSQWLLKSFAFVAQPGDKDRAYVGKEAHINVRAEAIQTANAAIEAVWGISYDEETKAFTQLAEKRQSTPGEIQIATEVTAIRFTGNSHVEGISFDESKTFPIGGLFSNFNELYPGDVRQQELSLINETNQEAVYKLVMKAATQQEQQDLEKIKELLYSGAIQLKITADNGKAVIYNGPLGGDKAQLTKPETMESGKETSAWLTLGTVSGKKKADIQLILTVNPEMGNEYENLLAKVDWMIQAQWVEEDSPSPSHSHDDDDDHHHTPSSPSTTPSTSPSTKPSVTPQPSPLPSTIPSTQPSSAVNAQPAASQQPASWQEPEYMSIPGQQPLPKTGGPLPLIIVVVGAICIIAGVTIKMRNKDKDK